MTSAITARGLTKRYREQIVLDGVDLDVAPGTVLALLGPNGAGKTTAVHILSTLVRPDAGTATIAGHDLHRDPHGVRAAIGLTGQFAAVDGLLTGEENLRLMADLRHLGAHAGSRRVAELLERFDLTDAARKPLVTYSGGMKRRLDLAMTLVGTPQIVFLDEPTTGLDPRSRQTMWEIVRELLDDGVTIFLTTQYLEEADRVADRVVVLDHGRVVGEGTPSELKARVGTEVLIVTERDGTARPEIPVDGTVGGLRDVLAAIDGDGSASVSLRAPSLDDVFFALTGSPSSSDDAAPTSVAASATAFITGEEQ
ncbi:ATP-binding cassette domain-containing protein [Sinomonas terrae]|uniref:ATP-binding cassette domain-containing protein n=1 Tax=Sinomonas terrae TaxID=2908838 RepID=A0ABS9TVH0_9MICC|nr:ATP-binding cassette domain-containing protein [Sinomonas terrae]MCH6468419.1 ATP-binding cassette domain-containing protein [Sinomonas terrae]